MSGQTAADLRSLVARRVGLKKKVVLLGSDPQLVRALEGNGCTVLADPESLPALTAFAPDAIVAFDGFAREGGAENFAAVTQAAPNADVVFSFANASSASSLLQALVGKPPPPALAEPDVRGWLQQAGLHIVSRDVVIGPHQSTGLAVDAEAQLRQLLEQLNPDAGAERLLLVARRTGAEAAIAKEPGLLSIVVSSAGELSALQGTLASLGAQPQRPMQVVVVTSGNLEEAQRLSGLQAERHGFAVEVLGSGSADFAVRTNKGLTRARGQYVAFLEAGDSVERIHFRQLMKSLDAGTSAWVIARLKQPGVVLPQALFSLPDWLQARATARCAVLIDRLRTGPFPLAFAEGIAEAEPLFLARLAALFPAITSSGLPSAERPTAAPAFDATALQLAMKARPLRAIGPVALAGPAVVPPLAAQLGSQLNRWLKPK